MQVPAAQFLDHMTYQGFVRPLFSELFGPLVGLEDEWRAQGATAAELDLAAFDFDYVARAGVAVQTGLTGGQPAVVLEETADYVVSRDGLGRTTKLFKRVASIPLPLDYPVHDFDSWRAFKPRLEFSESRFGDRWEERARAAREAGLLICCGIPGGFDLPRQLMGEEVTCLSFYDDPELILDILQTAAETAFRVLERVSARVTIDVLSVHEDLAGKSGSLVGPAQIRQYLAPYYRRTWDLLRERGTRLFQQDSDGDMNSVLEHFVVAGGINSVLPVEPAAGMNVVQLRQQYGTRLAMLGGLDKHVLRRSQAEIASELEAKLLPLRDEPGIVFGLDHRIPPGTPLANYRYYVATARELLGLPPARRDGGAWHRMAF
ncbi:MAG: hypothetical protein IT204_22010 [Fimbriimonadaceae bacterium]|nr:hypothetical protein [Fimbriimonadaceae bacterium]